LSTHKLQRVGYYKYSNVFHIGVADKI